jgi:low affinity Fe/Cu permease
MPPERTAPNALIGLEEKQRDLIKKRRRRLAQKVILPEQGNFDTPLDHTVAPMVRHVTR